MPRPVAVLILLLSGCQRAPAAAGPEREYGFVHMETTGLTGGILLPGSVRSRGEPHFPDVMIVFSRDSDGDALSSLGSLKGSVLIPNADGDRVVIVGVLDPTVRHTPSGRGMAESEPYQEFRLSRWYLRAPFLRVDIDKNPLDLHEQIEDHRLRPEDFDNPIGGDLARFVRPR